MSYLIPIVIGFTFIVVGLTFVWWQRRRHRREIQAMMHRIDAVLADGPTETIAVHEGREPPF